MASNPLSKLVNPHYPAVALGLESGSASMVHLERRRQSYALKRAAMIALSETLVRPDFDERNIADQNELADALAELATSAGLAKQSKWSVALPEAATRAAILTLESAGASRAESEEILRWKTERAFGLPLEELRVARERMAPDTQGRPRYLAVGIRQSVLAEYEDVFAALGWRAGLILPRHVGEERWLMQQGAGGDALLISSHAEGFTAVLLRDGQPVIVRSILCDAEDRDDELFRLLLFYRDRISMADDAPSYRTLERLFVIGDHADKERISEIVNETLGISLHALRAEDFGLSLPSGQLDFDAIAAPAGLATLAWT